MLRTALCTASALAFLTAGLAADPAPPVKEVGHTTSVRVKSVLGAKVSLQGGSSAGTVEDIVISEEGVVDYLIVSDSGGKLVTVPWEAAKFNYEKRLATINITDEQYKQIPTFTIEKYPEFYTPAYRTQVYKYYGLTPGQERRLERRERKP